MKGQKMPFKLSKNIASTIVTQIRQGYRPEYTILLGHNCDTLGFTSDEQAVIAQIERALCGEDLKVSTDVRRHLSNICSSRIDLDLMQYLGFEPGVAAFFLGSHVSIFGQTERHDIQYSTFRMDNNKGNKAIVYSIKIDETVTCESFDNDFSLNIQGFPETVINVLRHKLKRKLYLKEFFSHPVFDKYDLQVENISGELSGYTFEMKRHEATRHKLVSDLIDEYPISKEENP